MCSKGKIMVEMAKLQQSNTEGQCSSHPPDIPSDDEDISLLLEVSSDEYVRVDEKRKRQPSKWKRNIRKQLKARGKEYVSVKGSIVAAKCLKAQCNCKGKCYLDFTEEERHNILHEFFELTSEAQNQFIATNVEESEKKIQRQRRDYGKRNHRTHTRQYYLPKGGSRVEVCQTMFLNTLCLGLKKVRVIIVKKHTSGTGVAPEDARGRHANHPRFRLYQDYCKEQSVLPRNEALYRKIFVEEFNLKFKKQKNYTCGKCDRYELVLKSSKAVVELEQVEKEKKIHLELAEYSYEEKRKDKLHSKGNCNCITMSFDLQKCLPTPLLMSGATFYKRQL
ncbi:hypothetical protein PR048_027717 [Dryococelus australis]|uniref:Uncharacterized protein n=1 Tax=Dryococelus australis TaxID=614101 RepID=A0ABQ9GHB3_9NEOP|nr:hypothetical protein PR048_027717 [Dryococelus australis]